MVIQKMLEEFRVLGLEKVYSKLGEYENVFLFIEDMHENRMFERHKYTNQMLQKVGFEKTFAGLVRFSANQHSYLTVREDFAQSVSESRLDFLMRSFFSFNDLIYRNSTKQRKNVYGVFGDEFMIRAKTSAYTKKQKIEYLFNALYYVILPEVFDGGAGIDGDIRDTLWELYDETGGKELQNFTNKLFHSVPGFESYIEEEKKRRKDGLAPGYWKLEKLVDYQCKVGVYDLEMKKSCLKLVEMTRKPATENAYKMLALRNKNIPMEEKRTQLKNILDDKVTFNVYEKIIKYGESVFLKKLKEKRVLGEITKS